MLYCIVRHVGGDPYTSARGQASTICLALFKAGVKSKDFPINEAAGSSIFFESEPPTDSKFNPGGYVDGN